MTVRVTTVSGGGGAGAAVGLYYGQVIERQKDVVKERDIDGLDAGVSGAVGGYYESASGAFWMGKGAARLGLDGVPNAAGIGRLVDGVDADGVQLGRKFGEASARAFDVTFSVQKEISILWAAAAPDVREVIEQAVVDAAVAVLDDQVGVRAATRMRTGPNGEFLAADERPVMVDAEGPAVAIIPEFTSRKGDPQLHVHGLVSSKVFEPTTERWLALEARELKQDQRALSGLFHAGLESELSAKLGVTWGSREYRYARTITGISDSLIDVFSQRRADVDARFETKLERFETELGHAPTPQQRWKLEREAAVDSRPTKSAEHLDFGAWHQTITDHTGMAPAELVHAVTGSRDLAQSMTQATLDDMITATLGELSDAKSSWTRGDFKAEFARVLPPNLAVTPKQLVAFVNAQTDQTLDGLIQVTAVSVDRPNRRWTTPDVLTQEASILGRIDRATQIEVAPKPVKHMHAPEWMDDLQLAAAARVASTSKFELVVGLAGAGKTSMLHTAVGGLYMDGRDVFGLAPSSTAAEVLGTEISDLPTENISKFLWEHLERTGGPSPEYQLETGGTLIIDEAGMVSTPHWDVLTQLAETNDWRIVAVGDGYQFSAVGRGGIFDHLTSTLPTHRISRLEQVHRFDAAWEADASALLRTGDQTALDTYEANDRITPTGERDLVDIVTDLYMERHNAETDVGVFAATNTQVAELNTAIQTALVDSGQLGEPINTGNRQLFVGDLIETRSNNRDLVTDRGQYVKNRDRWTITGANKDGGLVVTGTSGTVTLPAEYADSYVNLGYAQTAHASQGRTIAGTSIYAYNPEVSPTDRAGIYVPLTRGKQENLAVVTAENAPIAKAHLADAISRRWIDTPAISHLHNDHQHLPVEPIGLGNQTAAARNTLDTHQQQPPLPKSNPMPLVEPEPPGADVARRSEAQPRQQSTPQVREPAVLSPGELISHLETVHELKANVERAPQQVERLVHEQHLTRTSHNDTVRAHNDLVATRNDHAGNKPLRGRKTWEATLDSYDSALANSRSTISQFKDRLEQLDTDLDHWNTYRGLSPQLRLSNAQTAIDTDRQLRGAQLTEDPGMISRLGPPPAAPEALTAWRNAAGAITHQQMFKDSHLNHPDPDHQHYNISRGLNTDTKQAVNTLGNHVGHSQVPELEPKHISRQIDGPSRGLGF